jgi:hypothetical protein
LPETKFLKKTADMLQPFELFLPVNLDRLISQHKIYLVIQTYTRGHENHSDAQKINILVSDYEELNDAELHFNAIKSDKNAALIHLDNPLHKNKLDEMLHGEKYTVYWNVVKRAEEMESKLDGTYNDQIKKYIKRNTSWRIAADETITPIYEVAFGELFINLNYNTHQLRIRLEDVEKM